MKTLTFKTIVGILCILSIILVVLVSEGYISPTTSTSQIKHNNIRNLFTFTEHFKVTEQDVAKVVEDVKILLDPYMNNIKNAAAELRRKNRTFVPEKTNKVLNAYKGGYFEEISNLPSVRTIFAEVDFNHFLKAMNPTHYQYGSTNCSTLEAKGTYGRGWAKQAFNDTCLSDFSKYKDRLVFSQNYLTLGLPTHFRLKYPKVALTFMHVISNAFVRNSGDVYVDQTKLLIQRCSQSRKKSGLPKNIDEFPLYNEVFTISQYWGMGFFHFSVEDLIRISPYIEFLKRNTNIKIHVYQLNGFTKSWISALGISKDRLISGTIKVSLLYAPAGTPCGRPTYLASNLLSLNLRQSLGITKSPRDTVVVIKRSRRRYFKNHDAIWNMTVKVATKLGFKVQLFSDRKLPKLNETSQIFQRAALILGPHGAGLSNMFFSQPGAVILEGLCSPIILCYRNLAKVLGHRYVGLLFENSCFDLMPEDIRPYLEYFLQHIRL